jgi:hypothetical protein
VSAAGALLFARYAYPPNALGYCGPGDAGTLLRAAEAQEIARRARRFEGAWSYLEFIAASAGLSDPLDAAVVEAYWLGNDLLDRVDPAALLEHLRDRFARQIGGTWRTSARPAAHHSFQVFEVYPWAGLLAATGNPTAVSVLDQCRIRTGTVVRVDGESATVRARPLLWQDRALLRGPERDDVVRWSVGGRSLIAPPSPGDRVAVHWDWICDVVGPEQAARVDAMEAVHTGAEHAARGG